MSSSSPEAQQYSRIKNILFVVTIVLDLILFKVFFFSGQSDMLRNLAFSIKASAFLCGLGKNRRVVLSDTLVEHFTPSEIEVVVAHELGHYKHHDIAKLLVIQSALTFISFYAVDQLIQQTMNQFNYVHIDDIALLPMLLYFLTVINLMVMPLTNWFSRMVEKEADRFSIEVTKKPEDFISLMEKLAKMNLSEMKPNKWVERILYDHPSIDNRINFAKTYLTRASS